MHHGDALLGEHDVAGIPDNHAAIRASQVERQPGVLAESAVSYVRHASRSISDPPGPVIVPRNVAMFRAGRSEPSSKKTVLKVNVYETVISVPHNSV